LEKSKNVVIMDIINSLLKTGNKTANVYVKIIKRQSLTFRLCWCGIALLFKMIFAVFDPLPLTVCINYNRYKSICVGLHVHLYVYHRLRGSASPVLMATVLVSGKGQYFDVDA